VTVSIGATMAQVLDKLEDLVSRADGLMYQGKQAGRNQVRLG
jgi:PleD family two-component response regulator